MLVDMANAKKWTTTQCLSAECDHPEHQRGDDVEIEEGNVTIHADNNRGTVVGRVDGGQTWRFGK